MAFKDTPEKKRAREAFAKDPFLMADILFPKAIRSEFGIPWYARYIMWSVITYNKVIVKLPRFHAKSTYMTFLYVMWCILTRRKKFILIVSSTGNQAVKFLQRISFYLKSKKVKTYYGDLDASSAVQDTENESFDFVEADGKRKSRTWNYKEIYIPVWGIRVMASSIKTANRGLLSVDDRPDLQIWDDVEDKKNTNTLELRKSLAETLYEELIPAGGGEECQYIAIGTICHYGSYLLKVEKSSNWHAIPIDRATVTDEQVKNINRNVPTEFQFRPVPETFTKKTLGHDGRVYEAGEIAPEYAIWQDKYSYEHWCHQRSEYEDIGLSSSFWQEYYNTPKNRETRVFNEFRFLSDMRLEYRYGEMLLTSGKHVFYNGHNRTNCFTFMGGDLAVSDRENADWRVLITTATDPWGNVYVFPPYKTKEPNPFVFGKTCLERHQRYRYTSATFDGQHFQKWFKAILDHITANEKDEKGRRIYKTLLVYQEPRTNNKEDVISSAVSRYFNNMYFCGEEEEFEMLVNELKNLGYTDHDDHADALAYACQHLRFPAELDFGKMKPINPQLSAKDWFEENNIPLNRKWEFA